jgi:glycolate dehydrogenase FAD-binding subunit
MSAVISVDGIAARAVETPDSPQRLAAALASASQAGMQTIVSGGGTKLGWGRTPARVDLVISTSRLSAILAHRHGDLTATIQAGAALTAVNRELATRGQWLPIDTPFDEATIGGIIATNDAGPLRQRYGTARDLLIGVTLALADGRLVKAGGHVVKNVAGYDLGRFMSGSFGTLAAIVDATFKLLPIPAASRTVVARFGEPEMLGKAVAALRPTALEPIALDVHVAPGAGEYWLLVRFATSPAATDAQIDAARALLGNHLAVVTGNEERLLWTDHQRDVWRKPGAVVRVSWLPASLGDVLSALARITRSAGTPLELVGRAGVGAGFVRIEGDDPAQKAAIEQLRARTPLIDHVVVLRAAPAVKDAVDVWAVPSELDAVYRSLKRTFDPRGILNAGRGPI